MAERAAPRGGFPRHALRLRDTEEAQRDTATAILRDVVPAELLGRAVAEVVTLAEVRDRDVPAHRALADARDEWERWCVVRRRRKRGRRLKSSPPGGGSRSAPAEWWRGR